MFEFSKNRWVLAAIMALIALFVQSARADIFDTIQSNPRLSEVYEKVAARNDELTRANQDLTHKLREREQLVREQTERLQMLEQELLAVKADLADARSRLAKSTQSVVTPAPTPVQVIQSPGQWFEDWKVDSGYERGRDLVRLLGESGMSQLTEIETHLNALWKMSSRTPRDKAINTGKKYNLIEVFKPNLGKGGRPRRPGAEPLPPCPRYHPIRRVSPAGPKTG